MKTIHRLEALIIALTLLASFLVAAEAGATVDQRDVLIKGPGSGAAVYYLAMDNKRYVFPNQKTYNSWFKDFGGVLTVSQADLISFPLGGNVTYRPGVKLVKITTDPKVYAVDHGGVLRWLRNEGIAQALYGSDWNKKVDDVPDAFFTNYRLGADISSTGDFTPLTAMNGAMTINADRGLSASLNARLADTGGTSASTPQVAPPVEVPPSANACTADVWVCTTWNSCDSSGLQTRTCTLSTDCPNAPSNPPVQTQSCTPTASTTGTVSVTAEADPGAVAAGADALLAKFKLSAAYEDLRLVKASFNVATPGAVSYLTLYDGGTQVAPSAPVDGAGNAFFSGIEFLVPRNSSKDLLVKGTITPVGPSGVASGVNAKVTMKNTGGPYVFEMQGVGGSNTDIKSIPGGEQSGNDKIVRKAVPIIAVASLPTTVLTAGNVVAARVTVTASGGDLAMKTLTVDVQKPMNASVSSSGDGSHTTVRVYGNGENLAGESSGSAGCGAGSGTFCQIRTRFATEETIAAGSTKTYDIRLTIGGTLVKGDVLATVLDGDAVLASGTLDFGSNGDQVKVGGADVNFAWSDESVVPHDPTVGASSSDWASGMYVNVLPTDSQVLQK